MRRAPDGTQPNTDPVVGGRWTAAWRVKTSQLEGRAPKYQSNEQGDESMAESVWRRDGDRTDVLKRTSNSVTVEAKADANGRSSSG